MTDKEAKQRHAEAVARINRERNIEREKEMIRKAKNQYQNEWRNSNKEKVKEYNKNYWLKKAMENQRKEYTE